MALEKRLRQIQSKISSMTTFKKSLYFGRHKIHHYSHFCSKCSIKEGNNHGDRKSSKNRSSAEKLLKLEANN